MLEPRELMDAEWLADKVCSMGDYGQGAALKLRELSARVVELEAALKPFAEHYECEDSWYSCPMSEGGCSNDGRDGCTCGADRVAEVLNRK